MRKLTRLLVLACLAAAGPRAVGAAEEAGAWSDGHAIARSMPVPLADRPGNVYLEGEDVGVALPEGARADLVRWQARDDAGAVIASGALGDDERAGRRKLALGKLGIGWYRIELIDARGEVGALTSAAVLARLRAPTPQDSPVCVDSATSWFAHGDPTNQGRLSSLAALAGVNWVRDRLRWREIQPGPSEFAAHTTYDAAAACQAEAGLKVLQVFHDTPEWARDGAERGKFPRDLRRVYRFCAAMSARFRGKVQAWEPWNEANVESFGGHTVDEMCAFQKAAWLGFKAGDPSVTVGWNASAAVPSDAQADGVIANETWPYFDTYNIHTYDWPHGYPELWAPARRAACGRPLWITESDRGYRHLGNAPWCDLAPEGEQRKAELMAQEYALSLYAGAVRHFHFILGNYQESGNGVQFGLLRLDRTPRPAYVALAAVGRFLAGARCLGRVRPENDAHVYAFRARPDGIERDVLVAWAEREVDWPERGKTVRRWPLPAALRIEGVYDYLGRMRECAAPAELGAAPLFVLLPPGESAKLALERVEVSPPRAGTPSSVVLQAIVATARKRVQDRPWSEGFAYGCEPGKAMAVSVRVYNFGAAEARGALVRENVPQGCALTLEREEIAVEPGGCVEIAGMLTVAENAVASPAGATFSIRGEFGEAGKPVIAFRVVRP
jgi:hypothetical protein